MLFFYSLAKRKKIRYNFIKLIKEKDMKKDKTRVKGKLFWYLHPHLALALGLVVVNLVIILVFTGLLSLASGNSFFEELPYCFLLTIFLFANTSLNSLNL